MTTHACPPFRLCYPDPNGPEDAFAGEPARRRWARAWVVATVAVVIGAAAPSLSATLRADLAAGVHRVTVYVCDLVTGNAPDTPLKKIEHLTIAGPQDLAKIRPYCTERGYRVLAAAYPVMQASDSKAIGEYELARQHGDAADFSLAGRIGSLGMVRTVRVNGQWKIDDVCGPQGVWLSQMHWLVGA